MRVSGIKLGQFLTGKILIDFIDGSLEKTVLLIRLLARSIIISKLF